MMRTITTKDFIKRAEKVYADKYDYSKSIYINSDTKIVITCLEHGDFEKRPLKFLNGRSCSECKKKQKKSTKRLTTKVFIEKSKAIFGDLYNYSKVNYKNYKTKVILGCEKHGEFGIIPNYHLSDKSGCQECAKEIIIQKNTLTNYEFIKRAKEIHEDKYDYSEIKYVNINSKINLNCDKHGIFNISPLHHIHSKSGCPKCGHELVSKKTRDTLADFLIKSKKTHKNKYDYSPIKYINSQTKVKILCEKHGLFKQIPAMHIIGQGCPTCKESSGERNVRHWLQSNDVNFELQKKFDDCKNKRCLPFDFYLPEKNICIEFNGTQHYKMSTYFGKTSFDRTQINDKIKKEFCKKNNIELLLIKYNQNVDDILTKRFN